MNAERLMLLGGVTAFALTCYWVRGRALREKYALVWLFVASLLLLCGLFPKIIMDMAEASHLSYSAAVLFLALTVIYVFSFTVSVSLSRHHQRSVRLTQEMAILESRLRALEGQVGYTRQPLPHDLGGRRPTVWNHEHRNAG